MVMNDLIVQVVQVSVSEALLDSELSVINSHFRRRQPAGDLGFSHLTQVTCHITCFPSKDCVLLLVVVTLPPPPFPPLYFVITE